MRASFASALLAILIFLILAAAYEDSVRPVQDFPVHARVPVVDRIEIVADRASASRTESLVYSVYVNLTGGGSLQYAWVNLTFDPDLNFTNAITPSGCTRGLDTNWQCNGLRAGVHEWTIGVTVSDNAVVNRMANATATVRTYTNRQYTPLVQDTVGVWIPPLVLDFQVFSSPIDTARLREQIRFTVIVSNDDQKNTETAKDVRLYVDVSPWLRPSAAIEYQNQSLAVGVVLSYSFTLVVADNASVGNSVWIRARLTYNDSTFRPFGPFEVVESLLVQPPEIVSSANLVAGVLVGALAILLTAAILLFTGQHRIQVDEVFLVHSSGALIQHVSRTPAIKKDDDLMAAMLVAVQAFVKESLKREDTLDEFSFGSRRAAIVRGKDIVLAAIISRGDPAYMIPQLRAAIHALEQTHGRVLADWDGRLSRLDHVEAILDTLLRGGYRREAWTEWVGEAKALFRHPR